MKCVQCGDEIPYRANTCQVCGLKISDMENVGQKIEEKKQREINPFRWNMRDWVIVIGVAIFSGVIVYNAGGGWFLGPLLGLLIGCGFYAGIYAFSYRYIIWKDLRELALGITPEEKPLASRIRSWFVSEKGVYQRMAGYLAVICGVGGMAILRMPYVYEVLPKSVFDPLGLLTAVIGLIIVIIIGSTWEQPRIKTKRFSELMAIAAVVIVNWAMMVLSPKTYGFGEEQDPIVFTLILLASGFLIALFVYGWEIKRAIRNKGYQAPGLR